MTNKQARAELKALNNGNSYVESIKQGCWKCDGDIEITKVTKGLCVGLCNKCNASTSKGSAKKVRVFVQDLKSYYESVKA